MDEMTAQGDSRGKVPSGNSGGIDGKWTADMGRERVYLTTIMRVNGTQWYNPFGDFIN